MMSSSLLVGILKAASDVWMLESRALLYAPQFNHTETEFG
jgi:hypothetical protein